MAGVRQTSPQAREHEADSRPVAQPVLAPSPRLVRSADVLALQRSAGNAAVGRVLARTELEDYTAATNELSLFYARAFRRRNNHPSTGRGLFDVEYDPLSGRLLISVKLKFNFASGSAAEFPSASAADLTWTDDAEKRRFRRRFCSTVARVWSGRHTFYCTRDWWEGLTATTEIRAVPVDRGEHYTVTLFKIPPGQFRVSSVTPPAANSNRSTAEFDSEDLTFVDKPGNARQRAAVHEFGHMLGLGDEYGDPATAIAHRDLVRRELGTTLRRGAGRRIMQGGEQIMWSHGITFLEALRRVTNMREWSYRPRENRRAIPVEAMGDFPIPGENGVPADDSVPV